jgi:hypothetical protein
MQAENRSAAQVAIGSQVDPGLRKSVPCLRQGQGTEFSFPRLPQARFGGCQVCIVVAGVAYEFPGAFWNAGGDGPEQGFIEYSGDLHAQCSVRCGETFLLHGGTETGREALQNPHFGIAGPDARAGQKLA